MPAIIKIRSAPVVPPTYGSALRSAAVVLAAVVALYTINFVDVFGDLLR